MISTANMSQVVEKSSTIAIANYAKESRASYWCCHGEFTATISLMVSLLF